MGKNVLILTGSPRIGGNTDRLAESFAKGAKEAGHNVKTFAAGRADIKPCKSCNACLKLGKCVFEDDFQVVEPMLREADVVALVSPVFWYDISAQLKLLIDKFYSTDAQRQISESVLILNGAVEDTARFDGAVQVYKRLCEGSVQWKDRGVVLAGGCSSSTNPIDEEILKHPAMEEAYLLGKSL